VRSCTSHSSQCGRPQVEVDAVHTDARHGRYPNPKLVLLPILNLTRSDPLFCSVRVRLA